MYGYTYMYIYIYMYISITPAKPIRVRGIQHNCFVGEFEKNGSIFEYFYTFQVFFEPRILIFESRNQFITRLLGVIPLDDPP